MSEKLCPFCGCEVKKVSCPCADDYLDGNHDLECPLYERAIGEQTNWNRRPIEDALRVRVKELEKKNKSIKKALREIAHGEAGSSEPPSEMEGCMTSMSCFQCKEFQSIAAEALKGAGK